MTQVLAEGHTDVTVDDAYEMLSGDPSIFLLDARTMSEYENDGHIPGAYLIPHTEVKMKASELPADKGNPILVHCRSGFRSSLASQDLVELGYTDVRNMLGGFSAWADKGYPTVRGSEQGTFPVVETSMVVSVVIWALMVKRRLYVEVKTNRLTKMGTNRRVSR
jgi:hydroxyacylglutathione hydrolase